MNKYVVAIGLLLTLAGIVYPIFPVGLYVINSTSVSNISVSCNNYNSCVASATINNINGTSTLYVWFIIRNYKNQVVQLFQMTANIPQGSSQNIKTPVFVLQAGAYTMEIDVTTTNNSPISKSYSYSFTTGSLYLQGAVNKSGVSIYVRPYPLFKDSYGQIYYNPGTSINVTEKLLSTPQQNPTTVLSCLVITDAATNNVVARSVSSCPSIRNTTDPLGYKQSVVFTINTNVRLDDYFTSTTSGAYIGIKTSVSGQGTVNPSSARVYEYSSGGPTSVTFTFTPASGYYLDSWQLREASSLRICKSGVSTTATITYNDVYTCNEGNYFDVFLNVDFGLKPSLIIGADTGVKTDPAVGTYSEEPKSMVTVKLVSVQSGYCFMGWEVNGKPYGNYSAITLNMTQSYGVYAHAKQCINITQTTTTSGTTTITSTTQTTTTQRLPFIPSSFQISGLSILGIIVIIVGLVMKERD